MKKLLLSLVALLFTNVIFGQTAIGEEFEHGHQKTGKLIYKIVATHPTLSSAYIVSIAGYVTIPSNVELKISRILEIYGIKYYVTSIEENAFENCTTLTKLNLKDSGIETIKENAFKGCTNLTDIRFGNIITTIEENAFKDCTSLTTIEYGSNPSLTTIGDGAFYNCGSLTSFEVPSSVTTIGNNAFYNCTGLTSVICNPEVAPTLVNAPFASTMDTKTLTVPFGDGNYSSTWGNTNWRKVYYNINEGVVKTLSYNFTMTEKDSLINKGVLIIPQTYQLINTTNDNVNGIFEIETYDLPAEKWSFIGAPLTSGTGKYKLETVVPKLDGVSVSVFDYNAGNWSEDWARITTEVDAGEGYFAWSWNNAPTIFTNYGDGMYSARTTDAQYANYSYDYSTAPAYSLNNGDVAVTKSLTYNQGNWMALANPYTFKLNVAMFINDNTSLSTTQVGDIQGRCIYRLNSTNTAFEPVFSGEIKVTEGFFVNFANSGEQTATFKKSQRLQNANKSSVERDFIKIVMIEGENESEVLFAQNEEAEQGYDILDANKMFSPAHVTEHYFVTENKPLVKEEVKTLPYYATMKVKSYERKEVSFKAVNVPEGMSVSIIDRDEVFSLNNGEVYSTNITIGENHNRFKVLFGSSVGLEDVKDVEVSFYPNPTKGEIAFSAMIERIEVIDLTGRVLLSFDNAREINISSLSSGAYYLRLRTNESVVMQKVIKE